MEDETVSPPEYQAAAFQFQPQHGLQEAKEGKESLKDLNNLETADLLLLVSNERYTPRLHLTEMRSRSNSDASDFDGSVDFLTTSQAPEEIEDMTTYPFFCHRVYLKRCPYFRDLIIAEEGQGPMSPILSLSVPSNAHNFFEILRYVYTLKIDSRLIEAESIIGTFLIAELLQLDELLDACRGNFKMFWEDISLADDFSWRRLSIEQFRNLSANCIDMFDKYPHRQLRLLFRWASGWPEHKMYEVRKLVSEEMKNGGRCDKLDIREIEKLQVAFGDHFDSAVPPSLLMTVLKNNLVKQNDSPKSSSRLGGYSKRTDVNRRQTMYTTTDYSRRNMSR
ncbi:hypothetical protein HK098_002850 [Nowakowskiella sp. JEL0407]|nr:hypothetical protein HK098_002850 [Nowakowskiella sp. JEL0407]